MTTKQNSSALINWHFNWGCGGYNSVKATTKEEAMQKIEEKFSSFFAEHGVVNLEPDEDFKMTRASDEAHRFMYD